jgi:hypothetical protein
MEDTKAISAYDKVWVIELWYGDTFDDVFLNKDDAILESNALNERVKGVKSKVISLADAIYNIRQAAKDEVNYDY